MIGIMIPRKILSDADTEILVVINPDMNHADIHNNISSHIFTKKHKKVYCSLSGRMVMDDIEYVPYPDEVLNILS